MARRGRRQKGRNRHTAEVTAQPKHEPEGYAVIPDGLDAATGAPASSNVDGNHHCPAPATRKIEKITASLVFLNLLAFGGFTWIVWQQREEMITANQHAERSMRISERAWVGIRGLRSSEPLKAGARPSFIATLTNVGKTPARSVRSVIFSGPMKPTEDQILAEGWESSGLPRSNSVVFPEGTAENSTRLDFPISEAEMTAWTAGNATLYLFGNIKYKTIFDDDGLTTFCLFVTTDLKNFRNCDYGNNAK